MVDESPEMLDFFVNAASEFVGRENVNPLALAASVGGTYSGSPPLKSRPSVAWGWRHVTIR